MNISWDPKYGRFVAQFTGQFDQELAAVKAARFQTDGPPGWAWYTTSVKALNKLRANRPVSGLTITPEAFEIYKPLAEQETQNETIAKQAAEARKKAKKEQKEQALITNPVINTSATSEWGIGKEDLPPAPLFIPQMEYYKSPTPETTCASCGQPTYFYELPNLCLWCEKRLDKGETA